MHPRTYVHQILTFTSTNVCTHHQPTQSKSNFFCLNSNPTCTAYLTDWLTSLDSNNDWIGYTFQLPRWIWLTCILPTSKRLFSYFLFLYLRFQRVSRCKALSSSVYVENSVRTNQSNQTKLKLLTHFKSTLTQFGICWFKIKVGVGKLFIWSEQDLTLQTMFYVYITLFDVICSTHMNKLLA
jgi:hypothetical protein